MEIKNDIGKSVRKRLEDIQASPDDTIWENIEYELNKERDDRKPIFIWWRYGVGLLILLLSFFGAFSLLSKNEINNEQIKTTKIKSKEQLLTSPSSTSSDKTGYNSDQLITENENQKAITGSNHSESLKNTTSYIQNNIKSKKATKANSSSTTNIQRTILDEESPNTYLNEKDISDNEISKQTTLSNDSISKEELKKIKKLELESALLENEDLKKDSIKKKSDTNKWSVYPNVALTSYGAFGKSFTDQTTFNFGIYVTYFGSERLNIRLGLNRLNLNQSWTENSNHYTQKVNYTEASLELRYFALKKKVSPFITGGFGYHFLNKAELESKVGESISIIKNDTEFQNNSASINFGLGVQVNLIPHFYLNLEGGFKYYFSQYKNPPDFDPYTITIMSGIEYKF